MIRSIPHRLNGPARTTRRMLAGVSSVCVALATVMSALALAEPATRPGADEPHAAQGPETKTTKTEVKVSKVAPAPARKAAVMVKKQAAPAAGGAAFVVAAPMPPGFNNDAQIRQHMQQFRPILRAEYHVVRAVCRPDADQRNRIARDGEQALRDAARKYSEMNRRPMTVVQRAALDPRKQIRESLAKAVKARISGEMAARYEEEMARRDSSRKELAVRNLVARLDRDLVLGTDQRDKVAESLSSHWDDSWCTSLEMFMQDYQFLPPIPDHYVAPFLNDQQKTIWRSIQKVHGFWGGFGMMGGVMIDDPLEDDELRAARLDAAKSDPKPEPNQPMMMIREGVRIQAVPPPVMREAITKTAVKAQAAPKEQKKASDAVKEKAVPK